MLDKEESHRIQREELAKRKKQLLDLRSREVAALSEVVEGLVPMSKAG